jgi:hypothetical protein
MEADMRLSIDAATALCIRMGLSKQVIRKLKLRDGMDEDAVLVLANTYLRLVEKRRRNATPERMHSSPSNPEPESSGLGPRRGGT